LKVNTNFIGKIQILIAIYFNKL